MRAALLALALGACAHVAPPPPPPPSASCESACARMQALGCPAGQPTQRGATCVTVCENVMDSGIIPWDLSCMSRAPSCPAIDACNP